MSTSTTDRRSRAAWVGLAVTVALIAAAFAVPPLLGWQVYARVDPAGSIPPLHGLWDPRIGVGTIPAILLALAALHGAARWADALPWGRLLLAAYFAGLAWLLALALVDGPEGISRVLGNPAEYLETARQVGDVPTLLREYVERIPKGAADNWPIHVAGHPPGMLLFFVALTQLGLGGDLAAGLVVTLVAATLPLGVMTTLRALDREAAARSAAPYLVFSPTAVFLAVSADAVMAVAVAWGMAALALACRGGPRRGWAWAVLAGLLLGSAVMMSYGLPLTGILALAVLLLGRGWWALPVAAAVALVVVGIFAAFGFAWWEAYPVLVERYWDGVAERRPGGYWIWGDLAALAISAGPLVGAGLAATLVGRRRDPSLAVLVGAAVVMVVLADVSQMSRAEVERIWLPFMPWLTLGCVFLPPRWRRPGLALQLGTAIVVEHLLYTSW